MRSLAKPPTCLATNCWLSGLRWLETGKKRKPTDRRMAEIYMMLHNIVTICIEMRLHISCRWLSVVHFVFILFCFVFSPHCSKLLCRHVTVAVLLCDIQFSIRNSIALYFCAFGVAQNSDNIIVLGERKVLDVFGFEYALYV